MDSFLEHLQFQRVSIHSLCQTSEGVRHALITQNLPGIPDIERLIEHTKSLAGILEKSEQEPVIYLPPAVVHFMSLSGVKIEREQLVLATSPSTTMATMLTALVGPYLDSDSQNQCRFQFAIAEGILASQEVSDAKEDSKLFRKVERALCWTKVGEAALDHIHRYNVAVQFGATGIGYSKTARGSYTHMANRIKILRSIGSITEMSVVAVHEAKHSFQHRKCPEIDDYQGRNVVDQFVLTKLLELDANFADSLHQLHLAKDSEQNKKTLRLIVERKSLGATSHETLGRIAINWLDTRFVENAFPIDKHGGYPSDLVFKIFSGVDKAINWSSYERALYSRDMIDVLKSGRFEERVAASRFLRPGFLEDFCVYMNGESYLPENRHEFFTMLTQKIVTIHEPFFADIAQKAKEGRVSTLPKINPPERWTPQLRVVESQALAI